MKKRHKRCYDHDIRKLAMAVVAIQEQKQQMAISNCWERVTRLYAPMIGLDPKGIAAHSVNNYWLRNHKTVGGESNPFKPIGSKRRHKVKVVSGFSDLAFGATIKPKPKAVQPDSKLEAARHLIELLEQPSKSDLEARVVQLEEQMVKITPLLSGMKKLVEELL